MEENACIIAADNETTCSSSVASPAATYIEVLKLEGSKDLVVIPLLFIALMALLSFWKRNHERRIQGKNKTFGNEEQRTPAAALLRKQEFLSRAGDAYGYRGTPGGYIDAWRPQEFSHLQSPYYEYQTNNYLSGKVDDTNSSKEVYLDYAGAALPTRSQLQQIYKQSTTTLLANPHSTGPAASRALLGIRQAKQRVLQHLDGLPGRFSSMQHPPTTTATAEQCHVGYDVVFTSGATEGLRMVAERFPWQSKCLHCSRQSIFLYARNSHTSVVGVRNVALEQGGRFECLDVKEIEKMTKEGYGRLAQESDCGYCSNLTYPHLLAIPAECNFGGARPNIKGIVQMAQQCGWYALVDIAKAASTGPVSLKQFNPDFCVLSFYKLFGTPTGLGALMVKRSSTSLLLSSNNNNNNNNHKNNNNKRRRHYQGGGSVNIMLPSQDVCVPRSDEDLASFTNGSVDFRGILQLAHGFGELRRVGGMNRIHAHSTSLARELARHLGDLNHGNGRPAVVLYGAWAEPLALRGNSLAGPTVTLNVLRNDGSFVGYNEVSKLAALHYPPIQFRTGCFCNPGACQQALGLTDKQALQNYETAGHVCGDHIDLVNGQPTGAIRISFGKDSLWEDLDTVVMFLQTTFVTKDSREANMFATIGPSIVQISDLYLFPIKSCAAQRVVRWKMDLSSGKLTHDREFALVDTSGTAIRLQTCPKMGLIAPIIDVEAETMTVSAPGRDDLVLRLANAHYHDGENVVKVCGKKCGGQLWGDHEVSEWFSSVLGVQCWLARFSAGKYLTPQHTDSLIRSPRIGFANEQPILLISENAVAALNQVLMDQKQKLVGSRQFRPNIVVKSAGSEDSHIEDAWETLILVARGITFQVQGSCARCAMVDFDPHTLSKGKTLRALAQYRRRKGQITFGIFLQAIFNCDDQEIWLEQGDDLLCT